MKKTLAVMLMVLVSGQARAADKKTIGWTLVAAGGGLVATAFNYDKTCPRGYQTITVHENDAYNTTRVYCVGTGYGHTDIIKDPMSVSFERPALMWAGVTTASVGTILLLLPKRATHGVTVAVTPSGWHASKTFSYRRRR